MEVVNRGALEKAARKHAALRVSIERWVEIVAAAEWRSIADVRRTFPSADGVTLKSGTVVTLFNIAGNNYRVITVVFYEAQRVYVVQVLTHAEYDKGRWKEML